MLLFWIRKMEDNMKRDFKKILAATLAFSLAIGCTGCDKEKKEPKPTPKTITEVDEGNTNADGRGDGQSDVPLVVASTKFSKQFNPFLASSLADKQVVDLTQVYLVTNDRAGRIIYNGIDGELREFNDENYTYYGASDISVNYNSASDTTTYQIKIRDDLVFSDGEKLTIDDVIFSMYVLCDEDYKGNAILKEMPIKGLTNYLANSNKAEKISKKKVSKYIKKNYKKLAKKVYGEEKYFDNQIKRMARIALAKGKGKKVKNISGIQKINDYEMTIVTDGYKKEMTTALKFAICPLHYYGDTSKFNIAKNKFGFTRGNISSILANKTNPVGAGAYRFIKREDNVIYFNSNELYYLGCPEIAFLQLKDMTKTLQETELQLQKKLQESENTTSVKEEDEESPQPTVNPLAEVVEVTEETIDVIEGAFSSEEMQWITGTNSNNEFSGNTLDARFVGNGQYHYIGINADNVSVGKQKDANSSKYLRKALASVFSDARSTLKKTEGANIRITDYPVVAENWLAYAKDEEKYTVAYSKDIRGAKIFETDEEAGEERTALVSEMALEYLKEAGYQVEGNKAVAAPKGASLAYTISVVGGENNALYPIVERAIQIFADMGITLKVENIASQELMDKKLGKNTQQIWVGSRDAMDMELAKRYAKGKNIFGLQDDVLNKTIKKLETHMTSSERKEMYQRCFDYIMDWAVEVPVGEYQNLLLYSSKRIDEDTIAQDTTIYYNWMNEIQKVCMD